MVYASLAAALAIVVVVIFVLLTRKSGDASASAGRSATMPMARDNMLQIVIPASGACAAARKLESTRYEKNQAPPLPLTNCDSKATCHCRYQLFAERRVAGERRSGENKREVIRYEENPRRKGRGRRIVDRLFDRDEE